MQFACSFIPCPSSRLSRHTYTGSEHYNVKLALNRSRFSCRPSNLAQVISFLPKKVYKNRHAERIFCNHSTVRASTAKKRRKLLCSLLSCSTIYHNGMEKKIQMTANDQNVSWWFFSVPFFWWISFFTVRGAFVDGGGVRVVSIHNRGGREIKHNSEGCDVGGRKITQEPIVMVVGKSKSH